METYGKNMENMWNIEKRNINTWFISGPKLMINGIWMWNIENVGRKGPFLIIIDTFQFYSYRLEKVISTFFAAISLRFAAVSTDLGLIPCSLFFFLSMYAWVQIFDPENRRALVNVLYVLLCFAPIQELYEFTDWLLYRANVWRDVDSSIYWHWHVYANNNRWQMM